MTTRFTDLLEPVPEALVGMDDHGVIWFVNGQTESLFGRDRDQLVGRPIQSLVLDPLWEIYAEHRQRYFADPRALPSGVDLELRGRRGDGIEFPISVNVSHIDVMHVLLVITAVHDRAQQRQAVKDAQLIAAIVDSSDDAIIASTTEGVITSWNPAAERMFGYSSNEIVGRFGGILTPEGRAGEMDDVLAKIRGGRPIGRRETVRLRKDGTEVPVSLTTAPIRDEDGEVVGISVICRDVTEQRKALALAERMTSIVENSNDAVIAVSTEGVITSWNPGAERLYGYSSEEIVGRPVYLITPEDRRGEIKAVLAKVRGGGRVEHFETVRVRKDQSLVQISVTVSPIRDPEGMIVGASAIARDITEQKEALAVAERLASIVENSDDAIIGKTLDGVVTSWNPAAERLYGYSSEEIVGSPIHLLTPEDRRGETKAILTTIRGGQRVEHFETVRVRKDGTVVPVSLTVSPIRDPEGMIVGASTIARDITEQKKALAVSERMASIVENSDDAIISKTLDGIVTSWNPAAERLYGYSSEEIIGKPIRLTIPTGRIGEIEAILAKVRGGHQVEHLETVRVRKDKTLVPVSLTVSPIRDPEGMVVGASTISRDMTGQRQALDAAQQIAAIVQSSDDAIIGGTPQGTIVSWNPAAERLFGYTSAEIIGKPVSWLSPMDRAGQIAAFLGKVRAAQRVDHFETAGIRKDKTLVPISITISPIHDGDGAVVGASMICHDMSERKRADRHVGNSVDTSPDPLVQISPEGRVRDANAAAVELFGLARGELIGSEFSLYFADPEKARQGCQRAFTRGSVADYPLTLRRPDGTLVDVVYSASVFAETRLDPGR